jgi:hypothetical protein
MKKENNNALFSFFSFSLLWKKCCVIILLYWKMWGVLNVNDWWSASGPQALVNNYWSSFCIYKKKKVNSRNCLVKKYY